MASVWGETTPARIVSGDLYDFFSFSNGEVGLLCADVSGGDVPVGLFPNLRYQEYRMHLSPGCVLIVYTDGVTDALNLQGEEFGEARLVNCCNSLPAGVDAKTICNLLSRKVAEWATGVEEFDDTTLLVLSVR